MDALAPAALTLIRGMALLLVVAMLCWLILGLPLRIARRASVSFALGNLFLLAGMLLTLLRAEEPGYLTYHVALFCDLVAFSFVRFGIQHFEHEAAQWKSGVLTLAICGGLLLMVPPQIESLAPLTIIFSLSAGWIMLRATMEFSASLRRHFGIGVALMLASPFAVEAGAMLLRGSLVTYTLLNGGTDAGIKDIRSAEAVPLLWAFIGLALLLNTVLLGLTIRRLIASIREMSDRDGLTGVWSRRAIEAQMAVERERQRRTGQNFALIMIDLDHFKSVNDRFGHAAGDAALQYCCRVAEKCLRKLDLLGRFGGEEFMVLLPATGLSGACEVAERIRAEFAREPLRWLQHSIPLTASFGVALSASPHDDSALFRRADEALYRAKENGRNRVEAERVEAAGEGAAP